MASIKPKRVAMFFEIVYFGMVLVCLMARTLNNYVIGITLSYVIVLVFLMQIIITLLEHLYTRERF
jgi:hypothetical protein